MRNILVFAAVIAGLGICMARMADNLVPAKIAVASNQAPAPVMSDASASAGRRSHTIPKDSRGHFSTDGRVEGRRIGFMVDTGASVIALTERDAAAIGIRPMRTEFTAGVSTANGIVKAARVKLRSVDIGGLIVDGVDALVLPDGALSENLLGLSYLSRLKRYEFAGSTLVLEQ